MKYIIKENRVNDIILKYIEDSYPVNEINYSEGHDDYGNPDDSSYEFYYGDYDDIIFRWYDKKYWGGNDKEIVKYRVERSPLLSFDDSREIEKLNNLFGDKWKLIFKQWFYDNFKFEIKTII
jgi:hypothetical protein